ncbi:putative 2-dehydropantoate 2-reductase [mine drainage metagenome]|uniref:Putative 2-dehydropantoate 2-reductase n=1 Tax=mine drainage metagenome TaxID=410659 RepID=A0A1J5RB27_9ZZZZ
MRICVVGAGAIGGYLAVELAASGHQVTVIARGEHLTAIRERGLRLIFRDGSEHSARPFATDSFEQAGRHDLVILGLKAHQLSAVAADIPLLFADATIVLTLQNGLPWWYFQRSGGRFAGHILQSVDPGGVIARHIDAARVIHSVVYPAAELVAPGVIHHHEGNRFPLGEPDNRATERVRNLSAMFTAAGFKAPVLSDTRGEVWLKLLGNVSLNPISALAHATVIDICRYPLTRELLENMMGEAKAVAESLGVAIRLPIERRIAGAETLGRHKMSMLQDVEAGRALEVDALVGAVAELGELTGVPTPCVKALYACTKLLALTMTEARASIRLQPLA